MSSLADFVDEQRRKAGTSNLGASAAAAAGSSSSTSNGGIGTAAGSLFASASFSSFADLRSKLNSSISSLPLIGRSGADGSSAQNGDTDSLVSGSLEEGQLPSAKNRRPGSYFGSSWSLVGGGQDEWVCGLSRTQRLVAFFMALIGAGICFLTAAMLIPILIVSTRKFAALNSLGSLLLLVGFAILWGPRTYLSHLIQPQRRLCSVAYGLALFATLYSSLYLRSTVFTLLASIFQAGTLVWFVLSYIPGGERGLRWMGTLFARLLGGRSASTVLLPV